MVNLKGSRPSKSHYLPHSPKDSGENPKTGSGLGSCWYSNPMITKFDFPLYFFLEGSSVGIKRGRMVLSSQNL